MTAPIAEVDAIIVGAGFAGLYAAHKLRAAGLSVCGLERGDGVGGVWYWNRYPGARCDIESFEYSYSFSPELEQEWTWLERYAAQPEILAYLDHVADRFALRQSFEFGVTVTSARFDEETRLWTVVDDAGRERVARFLILAVGCLSTPKPIEFNDLDHFGGRVLHTSRWPHEGVDFQGCRVAIVGTGSSGVQSIPVIAAQADRLYVLQRTPAYSVPAWNRPIDPGEQARAKAGYADKRRRARATASGFAIDEPTLMALDTEDDARERGFESAWAKGGLPFGAAFADLLVSNEANALAADFVHRKIAGAVRDPVTATRLTPNSFPFGTKRMCVDSGYYAAFNRDNVELLDIAGTGLRFHSDGVVVGDRLLAIDTLVLATGFDAMTGSFLNIAITGRSGLRLAQAWAAGPRTFLGVMTAGFPNLFMITGPGSPSVVSNMVLSIEQHVDWIADAITYMHDHDHVTIEATKIAEDEWTKHVDEVAKVTLFHQANSWYLGANIPGKPRKFMPYLGGVKVFADKCEQVARDHYAGFALT